MKITITQEAEASKPQVDALLQLQWRQPIIKKALDYFSDTGVAADVQLAATPDFFMGHFAAALEFGAPEYGVGGSV